MVRGAAGEKHAAGDVAGLGVREVRVLMGRIEVLLGGCRLRQGARSARPCVRHRELRRGGPRAARRRRDRLGHPRRPGRSAGEDLPGVGPARRQAVSPQLAGDRTRGRRAHQGGPRLDGRPGHPGSDDSRRGAHERGVLLLRQGTGRRRPAGRDERAGRVPAVGRHRFSGRRLATDAARLPRASSTSTAIRFSRARRRRRRASWPGCSPATSTAPGSFSSRSARSSSRSCWRLRRRCASSSTAG